MKLFVEQNGNVVPVSRYSQANSQDVDGTSASAKSSVIDANESCVVRIIAKAGLYVAFGADPTAEAGDVFIPANGELDCVVQAGEKIAVLGGVANITKVG